MRGRRTGLLLTLILLAAAIPAVLVCCLHGPDRDTHAGAPNHAAPAAVRLILEDAPQPPSTRGCIDHAGPTQNPYIETATGGGGGAPASSRGIETAVHKDATLTSAAALSVNSSAFAADGIGPPLWLSTCVSRT